MAVINIRSLLDQLTGDLVTVFFDSTRQTGRVAALTDDLLVLCTSSGGVLWIAVGDIRAVRRPGTSSSGTRDDFSE